jgi:hypothetical protein
MAIVLSEGDIGKQIRITRGNEIMDWYLEAIDKDKLIYLFKKNINDPEKEWVNLPISWFGQYGHARLKRLEDGSAPMNVDDDDVPTDGGRRRRNRKTKRRHTKKRKSRRSRR